MSLMIFTIDDDAPPHYILPFPRAFTLSWPPAFFRRAMRALARYHCRPAVYAHAGFRDYYSILLMLVISWISIDAIRQVYMISAFTKPEDTRAHIGHFHATGHIREFLPEMAEEPIVFCRASSVSRSRRPRSFRASKFSGAHLLAAMRAGEDDKLIFIYAIDVIACLRQQPRIPQRPPFLLNDCCATLELADTPIRPRNISKKVLRASKAQRFSSP